MRVRAAILLLLWVLGVSVIAAGSGQETARAPRAALTCFVDGRGRASAHLLIGALLPKPEALATGLGEALGVQGGHVQMEVDDEKHVVTCSLQSAGHFECNDHRVRGQIQFEPLLPVLRSIGVRQIEVQFTHPRAAVTHCAGLAPTPATGGPWTEYSGVIPLDQAGANPVSFEFGYRTRDLATAFGPLLLLLLLLLLVPVIWTWRRLRCSATPTQRPGGWRVLGVPALLAWALWIGAVVALQADVIALFLTGLVQPRDRILGSIVLLVLPPSLVLSASGRLLRASRCARASATVGERQTVGSMAWLTPALLTAVGIAEWRDAGPPAARGWWIMAAAVAGLILAQRAWAAGGQASASDSRARALALTRWWLRTAIIVGLPLLAGWLIRTFQIQQPASSLWAGATLVMVLALLAATGARSFLSAAVVDDPEPANRARDSIPSAADTSGVPELLRIGMSGMSALGGYCVRATLSLIGRIGLGWIGCRLLDLPLDLEHGDEGLVVLFCVALAAAWDARATTAPAKESLRSVPVDR
jgi:hypothetical protein